MLVIYYLINCWRNESPVGNFGCPDCTAVRNTQMSTKSLVHKIAFPPLCRGKCRFSGLSPDFIQFFLILGPFQGGRVGLNRILQNFYGHLDFFWFCKSGITPSIESRCPWHRLLNTHMSMKPFIGLCWPPLQTRPQKTRHPLSTVWRGYNKCILWGRS